MTVISQPDTSGWGGDGGWVEPVDVRAWGLAADPEPGLAAVVAAEGAEVDAPGAWQLFVPGGLSRPGGTVGAGFAAGQAADELPPGVVLAGLAARAGAVLDGVSDDELVGVMRAWRRLASWVAAGEAAAVAELVARREAQVEAGADAHLAEHVADEVAAALTLTGRAAGVLADFAVALARLPATRAALAAGVIDRARAAVIADETSCLSDGHAAAVEAAVIGRAGGLTSGQLRVAARRAVLAADPGAAARRRREALKSARVEAWDEQAGTAALAGRDLPPADVLAADRRIDGLARGLKQAGAGGSLDCLRARVFTALLLGIPLATLHPQPVPPAPGQPGGESSAGTGTHDAGLALTGLGGQAGAAGSSAAGTPAGGGGLGLPPGGNDAAGGAGLPGHDNGDPGVDGPAGDEDGPVGGGDGPAGGGDGGGDGGEGGPLGGSLIGALGGPVLAGSVNLTLPLATWLGGGGEPGEAAGYWPIPGTDAAALARLLAARPGTRLCLTITGRDGAALAHACTRTRLDPRGGQPELALTLRPLAGTPCGHQHQGNGYEPPPRLAHLVTVRQRTCSFPGCARRAERCDLDHTLAHDAGGLTCECNLAPLCRHHHQAKQAHGWHLDQPRPGTLIWRLPHGRSYTTTPSPYQPGGP